MNCEECEMWICPVEECGVVIRETDHFNKDEFYKAIEVHMLTHRLKE